MRRVGLAPSALRFYDDCRVLRPAWVDGTTGYRFYSPAQEAPTAVLRSLREAGLLGRRGCRGKSCPVNADRARSQDLRL
nr:MerR family transcriptional regulator [Streptomyces sp. TBY4]